MPRRLVLLLVAGALVVAGVLAWGLRMTGERDRAEMELGLASARVLHETFAATNQLKVGSVAGEVTTKAVDHGTFGVLDTTQTVKAPYTVDYFIDLSRVAASDYAWDAQRRILVIDIPDITVGKPNIDQNAATVTQSGLFISRGAGRRMQAQGSGYAVTAADQSARSAKNMRYARSAALAAVRRNAMAPLRAAGIDNVRVEVRFASQRNTNHDIWDYTLPIDQVAAKIEAMRQGKSPVAQKEAP